MHITITALGSRGDVQPCVALGEGLRQAGHQVRLATYSVFAELVSHHGLEFAPVEGDPRQAMEQQSGQEWLESGKNVLKFIRGMRDLSTYESLRKTMDDIVEACRGTDAVLYTVLGAAGYHVAEMLHVPSLYLLLQPLTRSRERPSVLAPALPLGGIYNRWTHALTEQLFWQMVRAPINQWRRESLHLKPMPFRGPFDLLYQQHTPFIYGFSPLVVPRARDWPDWHFITGYWFLDDHNTWSPPTGLVDFLANGSKPVYIGFGSMSGRTAQRLADLAIEAVQLTGQRAILLGGWAQAHQRDLPDSIHAIESAPHAWLFPQMAAVVHHGGAGTTAAGLRAGVPSVLTPFFGDQPYWGQRVHALGVGPKPIMRKALTARHLAEAITQAVTDEEMRRRAAELGEQLRAEDGVSTAVTIIIRYLREKGAA
jgi:sterol 3beta-glucosyltransferase